MVVLWIIMVQKSFFFFFFWLRIRVSQPGTIPGGSLLMKKRKRLAHDVKRHECHTCQSCTRRHRQTASEKWQRLRSCFRDFQASTLNARDHLKRLKNCCEYVFHSVAIDGARVLPRPVSPLRPAVHLTLNKLACAVQEAYSKQAVCTPSFFTLCTDTLRHLSGHG